MGDRGNIFAVDSEPDSTGLAHGIYLYTHWRGAGLPEELRLALNSPQTRARWGDESYLLRIVVSQLFADYVGSETGAGISTWRTSGEYEVIVLDLVNRVVAFAKEGTEAEIVNWYGHLSFAEYVDQVEAVYPDAALSDGVIDAEVVEEQAAIEA